MALGLSPARDGGTRRGAARLAPALGLEITRRDRSGDGAVHRARARGRAAARQPVRHPGDRYAGRPRELHARDHQRHPGLVRAGRRPMSRHRARGPRARARTSSMPATSRRWRRRPISAPPPRCRSAAPSRRRRREKPGGEGGQRGQSGKAAPAAEPEPPMSAEERKVLNDSIAYIRGLAQLRGRNADWAEQAVRGAASLPANQALQQHVIDLIAPDLAEPADTAEWPRDAASTAARCGSTPAACRSRGCKPDWRTQLLGDHHQSRDRLRTAADRHLGPALRGLPSRRGVCPAWSASSRSSWRCSPSSCCRPISRASRCSSIGAGMMAAEFFFPTYGSLGIGGLIAFIVGSLILFSARSGRAGGAAAHRRPRDGRWAGHSRDRVSCRSRGAHSGRDRARRRCSEPWWRQRRISRREVASAMAASCGTRRSAAPLRAGQAARVVKVEGLTLWVEPLR